MTEPFGRAPSTSGVIGKSGWGLGITTAPIALFASNMWEISLGAEVLLRCIMLDGCADLNLACIISVALDKDGPTKMHVAHLVDLFLNGISVR
ncbi:hypothetical protein ABID19_002851 [Mesorhizobium robiniae]|uniref:LysR substrate-binding domain-containing protein n=1 Tax=Mesorhizobium robiniae TaxID=559315 RepID=A0ABV2GNF1_9HYPH